MPTSSPMMTTIFGCFAGVCAIAKPLYASAMPMMNLVIIPRMTPVIIEFPFDQK
jgi:hypothetical protein